MRRRPTTRHLVVLVALGILAAVSAPGFASKSAPRSRTVVHGPNGAPVKKAPHRAPEARSSNLNHGTGEPTLGFTRNGTVFVASSDGCVTSCVGSTETVATVGPGGRAVLASADGGKSWVDRSPGAMGISPHVISLDPYVYVDSTPNGNRIFNIDLTLACAELSFSDNNGTSWTTNPIACGEPINDHQTLFSGPPATSATIGYPKVLYYCFNHPAVTKCNKSINGGLTFMTTTDLLGPDCGGLNGHGVVGREGEVYLPLASCGRPVLAISPDEGNTWRTVDVSDLPADSGGDPSVAIDAEGNLYYLFVSGENRLPYLVASRDGGDTWTKAIMVAPRGVQATNLATLDAGRAGNVAIAYYGTTDTEADVVTWNGYVSAGVGVLGKSPVFYTSTINDPRNPLKINACGPGRCGRVLDFIDVEISPKGEPWGAFVDACQAACEEELDEKIEDNEGLVGWLAGGPRL
jgi:hypothetical protein